MYTQSLWLSNFGSGRCF